MRTSLLLNETPLIVLPRLAIAVGLENAIVIQQLYWLLDPKKNYGTVLKDDERYIFNTYEGWQKTFPWWSVRTIQRIFVGLEKSGWVVAKQPDGAMSRRKYYRLNRGQIEHLTEERLNDHQRERVDDHAKLAPSGSCQVGMIEDAKLAPSSYRESLTENTPYTHTGESPIRDECVEALASLNNPKPTKTDRKLAVEFLKAIREQTPVITPVTIRFRAANYATWFSVPVTARALAKWWGRCEQPRGVGVIPAEPLPQISDEEREMWANGVKG